MAGSFAGESAAEVVDSTGDDPFCFFGVTPFDRVALPRLVLPEGKEGAGVASEEVFQQREGAELEDLLLAAVFLEDLMKAPLLEPIIIR